MPGTLDRFFPMHDVTPRLARLRAAFPVAERWIYFNHAAVAPLASPVADAVAAFLEEAQTHGSTGWRSWLEQREVARRKTATWLGADADEIAFTTSTSQGLISAAEGIPLSEHDEILVIQDDFPANHIPWFRQERTRGARVVVVPRVEGRVPVEHLLAHVTGRTRIVAVPWVLFDNGFRLDVAAIGRALADHPAWFCVDAIQGLGAFPLDVHEARIDLLSADSHKWMLGMEGIGVFYCARHRIEALDTPLFSWTSVEDAFTPYRRDKALLPDARRFEYGALPTMEIHGLDACLDLLLEVGMDVTADRILLLTARLASGLRDRGWTVHSPWGTDTARSGVLTASHPHRDAAALVDELERLGISTAPRGAGVRFSPHAWNTPEEVDRLLELLPR